MNTQTPTEKARREQLCTTCGIRPRQPGQRKCRECHAEYMRDWRLKQTTIRLTDDNYEYLRRRSFDERISMSRLINQAIADERLRRDGADDREGEQPRGWHVVSRETKHA